MSDHDFEKKVERKMDELRLRPSDAVWAGVETSLRRDKRRRRIVLWLPLMGILLTAGGYFMFTAPGNSAREGMAKTVPAKNDAPNVQASPSTAASQSAGQTSTTNSSSPKTTDNPSSQNSTPSGKTNPIDQQAGNENPDQPVSDKTVAPAPPKESPAAQQKNISPDNTRGEKTNAQREVLPLKQPSSSDRKRNTERERTTDKTIVKSSDKIQDKASQKLADKATDKVTDKAADNTSGKRSDAVSGQTIPETADAIAADNKAALKEVKAITPEKAPDSNAALQNTAADSAAKAIKKTDSAAKKPAPAIVKAPVKKKQPGAGKWQWGVTANGGMANISEGGLFDVLKTVRVDDLANAGPPSYLGIPPMPAPEPSPIDPGVKFSVGGFVQRTLSSRFSLSAGLQYSYFSVNTRVGKKVEAPVTVNYGAYNSQMASSYYRADNFSPMNDYVNRYHFAELPVTASYLVLKSKKFPLMADAGFSVSRMLNTNALHFDGISRVYFEDDDFFNKTQVSLNGALSLGILQKSKHPLWIGPALRYFTTGLLKPEVTTSDREQHLWSFGINAKMLLKK